MSLSLEELDTLGVLLTEEQTDYYQCPENRTAVAIYGVPDPERLYFTGPHAGESTMYQLATEGEPARTDGHLAGYRACVLPVVIKPGDQEESLRIISDYIDLPPLWLPSVHGEAQRADYMWRWGSEECPITVAVWDLWPIPEDEASLWADASYEAFESSVLPQMFELVEAYNGSEYYGERAQELYDQIFDERDPRKKAELELAFQEEADRWLRELESEILHPSTGDPDPQVPPVSLPSEQDAIWHSLQSLSWRNWRALAKHAAAGGLALDGVAFEEANRGLCPWY